jgi:hypothetical protein
VSPILKTRIPLSLFPQEKSGLVVHRYWALEEEGFRGTHDHHSERNSSFYLKVAWLSSRSLQLAWKMPMGQIFLPYLAGKAKVS